MEEVPEDFFLHPVPPAEVFVTQSILYCKPLSLHHLSTRHSPLIRRCYHSKQNRCSGNGCDGGGIDNGFFSSFGSMN
eukprot:scaffold3895_cov97-Alexandrium_tamarense.AAC.2